MSAPLLSVVITAHNEAAHIGDTIRAVLAQQDLPGPLEIVLVDDRSTDGTAAAARAAGDARLRVLEGRPDAASALTTRQQALDLGFRAARGEVVLTLDADSALPPRWAARLAAPILSGEAGASAGPIGFAPVRGWVALWQNCDAGYYFLIASLVARAGFAAGVFFGNFAFRRSLYDEIGGFDAVGFALTEDLAFAQALHRAGVRLAPVWRDARVTVRACPDFDALVARTLRISSGPLSALAVVLTLWPLSLPALLIAALATMAPGLWLAFALRYALGVGLVLLGLRGLPGWPVRAFAAIYEPGVFRLTAAVLARVLRGETVGWGGKAYDR